MSFGIWESLEVTGRNRENLAYSLSFSPPVVTYAYFPEMQHKIRERKNAGKEFEGNISYFGFVTDYS